MGIIAFLRSIILPLLLAIVVLSVLYWLFKKGRAKQDEEVLPPWETKLWIYTFAATIFIIVFSAAYIFLSRPEDSNGVYVPAHIEDGNLIKGKTIPDDKDQFQN